MIDAIVGGFIVWLALMLIYEFYERRERRLRRQLNENEKEENRPT